MVHFYLNLFSHDIGNLHQSLFSNVELALSHKSDAPFLTTSIENISLLTLRSIKMVKFVELLSSLSDSEAVYEKIDLCSIIKETKEDIINLFMNIKVDFEFILTEDPVYIRAEKIIRELVFNLIHNGIKFQMDTRKPKIRVELFLDEDRKTANITITDWGPGIKDDMKSHVFNRMGNTDDRMISGLGLSLCNVLIGRYQGSIEVKDRISGKSSQGATFHVKLPIFKEVEVTK